MTVFWCHEDMLFFLIETSIINVTDIKWKIYVVSNACDSVRVTEPLNLHGLPTRTLSKAYILTWCGLPFIMKSKLVGPHVKIFYLFISCLWNTKLFISVEFWNNNSFPFTNISYVWFQVEIFGPCHVGEKNCQVQIYLNKWGVSSDYQSFLFITLSKTKFYKTFRKCDKIFILKIFLTVFYLAVLFHIVTFFTFEIIKCHCQWLSFTDF